MRRGYAIMMDSVLALVSVLIIFMALSGTTYDMDESSSMTFQKLHYISEDAMDSLNKKGVLDQVGEYWAAADGNASSESWHNASDIASDYLESIIPPNMGYMLTAEGDVIANNSRGRDFNGAQSKTHSIRLLVGYGRGLPTRGNVARVFLTNIKEKQTLAYYYFGGYAGQGNLTVYVRDIPADASIQQACLELNAGSQFTLYVNGDEAGTYSLAPGAMSASLNCDTGCVAYSQGCGLIPSAELSHFRSGDNKVELRFTGTNMNTKYVGGGFIRVLYNTSEMDTDEIAKTGYYWFPGISGVINLYDSFYVPGRLQSMSMYLHFKSNYSTFMNIGSNAIFNSSAGNMGDQYVNFTDQNFSDRGLVYYPDMSRRTVPIRFGTSNFSVVNVLDIALVNDRSGSMNQSGWTLNTTVTPSFLFENVSVPDDGYGSVQSFSVPAGTERLAAAITWDVAAGYNGSEGSEFVVNLQRPNGTWIFRYPAQPGSCSNPDCANNKVDPPDSIGTANDYYSGINTKPQTILIVNPLAGTWNVSVYGWNMRPTSSPPPAQNVTISVYNGSASEIWRNPTVRSINAAMNASYRFVDSMDAADRGAYVVFGSYAQLLQSLTYSKANLRTAISNTGMEGGTAIQTGVNSSRDELINNGRANSTRIMIILTDGQNDAGSQVAINAAQAAKNAGIVIFTIGMTGFVNHDMLRQMASQTDYYYYTPDASGLDSIYDQISEKISSLYRTQTINVSGNFLASTLYADSYLRYTYLPDDALGYGEISLTKQTSRFNDLTNCSGVVAVPQSVVVSDLKVTSFSGEHWTDYLRVRNSGSDDEVYRLWQDYGGNYGVLGDPYIVNVPASYVLSGENTTLTVGTGDNQTSRTGCSADDRAIYTARVQSLVGYGSVFQESEGCNWTIEFEDVGNTYVAKIPASYPGLLTCNYTSSSREYNSRDAMADAVYRLMRRLDLDDNGKIDLSFDPTMINFEVGQAGGVKSLWGPAEFKLILWM